MPSPVEFIRKEIENMKEKWSRIRAACGGQEAVKALGDKVLPRPTYGDQSAEAEARYQSYLGRAVFYNVSGRTLEGLAGYVFAKEPVIKLPADIQILEENIDGAGVTAQQQAKSALREVLAMGRCGLLVDYPQVAGKITTKQDVLDGKVSPTIILYLAEDIINWRTKMQGAKVLLVKLVLRETYVEDSDENEFEAETCTQYRVLDVEEGKGVTGRIFRQPEENGEYEEVPDMAYEIKGKSGTPMQEIPFTFLGAVNNDDTVDTPPLLDLVNLNLAHFCNSADYEEACFLCGQPTPWASGLTKQWVDEVLKGKIMLGSRAVIPLPEHGAAGLLQADPNSLPMEAMVHKESQMVAIGAKLIQDVQVQKTATEAGMDHSAEVSTLAAAAMNVFAGYETAFALCCAFVGTGDAVVKFELSSNLNESPLDSQTATAIVTTWQAGLIDFEEARNRLKLAGWAFKEDDKAKAAIEADGIPPGGAVPGGAQDPNANPPAGPKPPTTPLPAQ